MIPLTCPSALIPLITRVRHDGALVKDGGAVVISVVFDDRDDAAAEEFGRATFVELISRTKRMPNNWLRGVVAIVSRGKSQESKVCRCHVPKRFPTVFCSDSDRPRDRCLVGSERPCRGFGCQ